MSNQSSQMPEETQRPRKRSRKHAKPWEVWRRASNRRSSLFFRNWSRFGRYKDAETAKQVVRQKRTDRYFEYEVRHATS